MAAKKEVVVVAKCIQCGTTREIQAGEVAPGDMPTCGKCYGVMIAEKAKTRRRVVR